MFPLAAAADFSIGVELAIAFALGLGFGFSLERGGLAGARKLTAVFYLYDMAVVKVMFTAVVTAVTGLWLLSAFGLLSLSEIYVEPTNVAAQLVGGLLFGAGFIFGGYCPGTSVAAMATGRKDGAMFALGVLSGVYAYAELTPALDAWYKRTAQGEMTLPSLSGTGMDAWALVFIAFLALAAPAMRQIEARFAAWRPKEP